MNTAKPLKATAQRIREAFRTLQNNCTPTDASAQFAKNTRKDGRDWVVSDANRGRKTGYAIKRGQGTPLPQLAELDAAIAELGADVTRLQATHTALEAKYPAP